MSDIKVIIEGKEYICSSVEEQAEEKPRTGYERVDAEKDCWHIYDERVEECYEDGYGNNDDIYEAGNYYNDEQLAIDSGRAEMLMRRMRQWQALNDEPVDWNEKNDNCYICFDYSSGIIDIEYDQARRGVGIIYFSSEEKANEAIEVFRDDLEWYFTEYRQRLDEPPHIEGE